MRPHIAVRVVIVAAFFAYGAVPAFAQDAGVTLTVTPAATAVATGDPILLKPVLRNEGKGDVTLDAPFESFYSGVRFEVCPPGGKDFAPVLATDEGRFCGLTNPYKMGKGEVYACYSTLFMGELQGADVRAFSTPGEWQVRVRTTVDNKRVYSPPVTVTVVARPKKAAEALFDARGAVNACVRFGSGTAPEQLAAVLEIRELLGTSEAGRVLDEAVLLKRLAETDAARPRAQVRADIAKHRDNLSAVARVHFDLRTAGVLVSRKEYDAARKLIDAAPKGETCRERSALLGRLLMELDPPE